MPEPNLHHPVTLTILGMFARRGNSQYGGEAVTQLEHALQAAQLAEREQVPPALIVAALLHDVGHLLHSLPEDAPDQGIDDQHEALAARWLAKHFDEDIVAPVRMHVAAKRFLSRDAEYRGTLTAPSELSLRLQGGPMDEREAAEFAADPHFESSVRLRRWDDQAKVSGLATPSAEHFAGYLDQFLMESRACR